MEAAFAALATGEPLDLSALRVVTRLPPRPGPTDQAPDGRAAGSAATRPPNAARAAVSPPPTPVPAGMSDPPGAQPPLTPRGRASYGPDARPRTPTAASPAPSPIPAGMLDPLSSPAPAGRPDPPADPAPLTALRGRAWAGKRWRDDPSAPFDRAAAGAELVARARRGRLPTLRVRGLRREPALELVAAFVARERLAGARYLRIVTGKGLGSPGEPVLKEALAEWFASQAGEQHVVAWAPELDVDGEFGAIVVQLRARR